MQHNISKISTTPTDIILVGPSKNAIFFPYPSETKIISDIRSIGNCHTSHQVCHHTPKKETQQKEHEWFNIGLGGHRFGHILTNRTLQKVGMG